MPSDYLEGNNTTATVVEISTEELPLEFLMNALRLNDGFPREVFSQRTGLPLSVIEPQLAELTESNLLEVTSGRIRATRKGHLFLNSVLERLSR